MILFILLKICDTLLYRTCLFLYCIIWPWWILGPLGLETIKERAHRAQASLQRYQPVIKSATVEFHKSQCFFMIAIAIAGQLVLSQRSLEDGSFQSLINYTLVGIISINGVLPVTLTLLCLHTVQMHSWYMLILSTWTVMLSTVTFFTSAKFTPSAQDIVKITAANSTNYSQCGYKDPSVLCGGDVYSSLTGATNLANGDGVWFVISSLVILNLVILDYCGFQELPIVQRFFKWSSPKPRDSRLQRILGIETTAKYFYYVMSNSLYLAIWIWYGGGLYIFLSGLRSFSPVSGWTFGQVVAITVWAAPIIEFVKLLVRKFIDQIIRLQH